MAGKNQILKPGQILFQEGDESNGMFIVRRGEIQVFLEKGDSEIALAKVGAGSMIGEMALFDKKPRSASARALDEVEVTVISNDDFKKILKQIPKWFVTLMATLSARLRETNRKLETLESQYKGNINPLEELGRILYILNLMFYKYGEKEVKSWIMEKSIAEEQISALLGQDRQKIAKILETIIRSGLMTLGKNRYKAEVLTVNNRGVLEKLQQFVSHICKNNPMAKSLPSEIVDIIEITEKLAQRSAYQSLTLSLEDLKTEGANLSFRVDTWDQHIKMLESLDPDTIEVTKNNGNLALKVNKKNIAKLLNSCKLLTAITQPQVKPGQAAA